MSSLNKVMLIGNLGRDPETRYAPDGTAFTNVSLATSEKWKDKTSGETKESTEWHRVVFAARLAEVAGEYLKKGSKVYVEGKITTRKWQNKEGQDVYTTEVRATSLVMLDGRPGGGEQHREERPDPKPRQEPRSEGKPAAKKPAGKFDDMEDDIPFN